MTTTIATGSATDTGRLRSANEDAKLVEDRLYAVADGMGGHQGGEVASKLAVDVLRHEYGDSSSDALLEAAHKANQAVYAKASESSDLRGMGTTLCAMALVGDGDDEELAWVHVGDSRIYLLRDGTLTQLTTDHSLVEDLRRNGQLSAEEAAVHPQRNIVTRALGIDPDVVIDTDAVTPFTGDRFLLCSDGLFNEVEPDDLVSILRRYSDPEEAATELVHLANEHGGRDNITCIVIDVIDDGGRSLAASQAIGDDPTSLESQPVARPVGYDDEAGDGQVDVTRAVASVPTAPTGRGSRDDELWDKAVVAESEDHLGGDLRHARIRRITWRVVAFLFALLLIAAGGIGAIGWTARHTFYVGLRGDQVTIFRGHPGGDLWFKPTVEQATSIRRATVPKARLNDLVKGKQQPNMGDARRYVNNLRDEIDSLAPPTTAPPTTAPPTTAPPTLVPPTLVPSAPAPTLAPPSVAATIIPAAPAGPPATAAPPP